MSPKELSATAPKSAAASIEDNYEEYLDDERGFAYDFADRMTAEDIAAQDATVDATALDLRALDDAAPEPPDALHLWMRARAWERLGNMERYFELCDQLLDVLPEHPLVVYPEISRRVARQRAAQADFSTAQQRLRTHLERWPEDLQAEQLATIIDYLARSAEDVDDATALRAFAARFPEDAEIRYEIAEDLWHFERPEAASAWLEDAREVATQHDLTTLVDIELLQTRLAQSRSTS